MKQLHLLVFVALLSVLLPSHTAAAPARATETYGFVAYHRETQHNITLPFLHAWRSWGGLPTMGFAKSEAFMDMNADEGRYRMAQYYERARFEHHPELNWPYRVLLGRLGVEILQRQGRDWQTFPKANPSAPHYFAETGHAIADVFWGYWSSHGLDFGHTGVSYHEALALWGYPLSEPQMETNSSGDTVLTQWFERARFEYHPGSAWPVQLGLLGNELIANRMGEQPFQPAVELDVAHAAAQRVWLMISELRGQPIPYRSDIQGLADQQAQDFYTYFNDPSRDILEETNQKLKGYSPGAYTPYGQLNILVTATCNIDPFDPAVRTATKGMGTESYSQLTIGVAGPFAGACGPEITMVYILSW